MSESGDALKERVRQFWSLNPMSYQVELVDDLDDRDFLLACKAVDRIFYHKLAGSMNPVGAPIYSRMIDYDPYRSKPALEVGFGMGSLLKELSDQGANTYGIDLSEAHVKFCQRRIDLGDIKAIIRRGDAEQLPYEDESFDLVVSHGVLHHTPNTKQCFDEIHRVLKPGGQMVTMLYHRNSFRVWYIYYLGLMPHRFRHPNKRIFCSLTQAIKWASDIHDPEHVGAPVAQAFTRKQVGVFCEKFQFVSHLTWDYPEILNYWPGGGGAPGFLKRKILSRYGYFLVTSAFKELV